MLAGKCCLITGSAQGIGKSIAEALLHEDAKVFLVDIKDEQLKQTAAELENKYAGSCVYHRVCDVTKDLKETFKEAHSKMGGLDIVANNAGIGDENDIEKSIGINLIAVINGTRLAMEYMDPENGGKGGIIINVSSIFGLMDAPQAPTYCASKTGVISYTSSLAKYPKTLSNNIRLNCLCPGPTDTDIFNTQRTLWTQEVQNEQYKSVKKMPPKYVADGFMKIVKDNEMVGSCLKVDENGYEKCNLKEVWEIPTN